MKILYHALQVQIHRLSTTVEYLVPARVCRTVWRVAVAASGES